MLEGIRVCAVFLAPFLPETSEKMLNQLNCENLSHTFLNDISYQIHDPSPLFQRIDPIQKLKEIEEKSE